MPSQKKRPSGKPSTPKRSRRPHGPLRRPLPVTDIEPLGTAEIEPGVPDLDDIPTTAQPASVKAIRGQISQLAAGDIDASWQGVESGEEAVGGSTPTPDQDNVDEIGSALDVVEQDEKPLATTEKIAGRDRQRWELDPASSEDFAEREQDEGTRRRRHEP